MKELNDLLTGVEIIKRVGRGAGITGIAIDSRLVKSGYLFAALKGSAIDGHDYIKRAVESGATAVLCEILPQDIVESIHYIQVEDARKAIGIIADNFFDHPSQKLKCIGVTGTNGKTTIATLLYGLFKELGYKVGLISTIEILVNEEKWQASLTTPDVISLHHMLHEMVMAGCSYAFMEVSSHAADQQRIAGMQFAGGIFTNITRDHLDYHGSFKAYIKAKQSFFGGLDKESFALTNLDDRNGETMIETTKARVLGYSLRSLTDYKARVISDDSLGTYVEINGHQLMTRLVGRFNMYNLLAVYAVAKELQVADDDQLIQSLSGLRPASGRLELVSHAPRVFVDYAHTPDALRNVLDTLKSSSAKGRLIAVFGAGGDRDKGKRPQMTRISLDRSDMTVLTSDNPRSENPSDILKDMIEGLKSDEMKKVLIIEDRESAIRTALTLANKEDTVVIAGKGHEQYQEVKGQRHFFSDQKIVKEFLS